MEHTYHLTGTFSELQELLQDQFGMNQKTARFAVCLLIMDQQQFVDELNEMETSLWYLNEQERFTTPVFRSRFSISFTDAKKNILERLIIQFAGIFVDGDAFAFSNVLSCFLALYRSGTYIKDEECCAYYQALKWKSIHGNQEYFLVSDILPDNQDNVCCYLESIKDNKWKCNFCHNEKCDVTEKSFSEILDALCERNVLKKYDKMYRFEK